MCVRVFVCATRYLWITPNTKENGLYRREHVTILTIFRAS